MGISGISPWSLLLILAILLILFGPQRLKSLSKELGDAVRSFRQGLDEPKKNENEKQ